MLLFSYGTLQDKKIQVEHFGRELQGHRDTLPGFKLESIKSGDAEYFNAVPSPADAAEIPGTVYEVTKDELIAADRYEEDAAYIRKEVTLGSGKRAWVYLRASD